MKKLRQQIASKVRTLRTERRWTQAELSEQLGLSQSRLSEIERGNGSFTAEQFLTLLRVFNVGVSYFDSKQQSDNESEIQNALARLGAKHLWENEQVLPSERLTNVADVVREALIVARPRLIAALGPALVANIDHVNFRRLHVQLLEAGLERRLGWLAENVLEAIHGRLSEPLSRGSARRYRKAEVVLNSYLVFASAPLREDSARPGEPYRDVLDNEIRSSRSVRQAEASSSKISKKWGIVTELQPGDFLDAMRAADAD